MAEAVELGRIAAVEQRWRAVCEMLGPIGSELSAPDLELLSMASYLRGQTDAAFTWLRAAHEAHLSADDAVGAARTAGWIAIEALEVGETALSAGWVARGLRLVEGLGESTPVGGLVALVPAALAAMFVGDLEEALHRFEGIAATAERNDDRELAAHAALGRGICLTTSGRIAEGFASLDQAMETVSAEDVSPVTICLTYRIVLDLWHQAFDLTRAEQWTSAFAQWCREQPELLAYTGQAHAYSAQLLLLHGDWAAASSSATLAEESLRAGDFTARFVANYQLAELHRLRGEFRAAEDHYDRAGTTGWEPQPGLALLRLAMGDASGAQTMLRRSLGGADRARRPSLLPAVVEAEIAADDIVAARRAVDELVGVSGSNPTALLSAFAATAEARVLLAEGDHGRALARAESARSGWAAVGAPHEEARCRTLLGRIHAELGDAAVAADEREAARAGLLRIGARAALAELTASAGGKAAGPLTPREAEVLRLVSTGLNNRGIAGRLSLSEKTVARHLSNIFAKLGLSSRAAATAYAYENGLI
ncbi:LuxR C-terminal-related transcriptional regulator [Microbacterium flavescens]|uniref:LuxR C-terminal-related transcriptional regulator n=1 Tax=Microbacterium flavescens TaxID=69366 RepID=UPI001BDDE3F0|nr:LuxR C-terminal-related transcriptional regulator [Microbacterium flavescens]